MHELFTPKQVARALGVGESSVKRWCDKGLISARQTAGGHRRIPVAVLMEFIRNGKYELVHPEALGLPPTSGKTARVIDRACDQYTSALVDGDELACRQIALDLYLAEHGLSVICDDVFAEAFRRVGEKWACGDAEVYQERRGCEITLRVLHDLRKSLPQPPPRAPIAIGCAAQDDQYSLGTAMAELVLRDEKWNATSLGDNLPFSTVAAAIRAHRPKLFWLSVSHIADPEDFLAGYSELFDQFGMDVAFVVGGYALTEEIRGAMKYSAYCDNMQRLETFAQTLHGALREGAGQHSTGGE